MASWLAMKRTRRWLRTLERIMPERVEDTREASRFDRTRSAQSARISPAKFADDHRHLGGRGVVGRDALSWHRAATAGVAPSDEVRFVRYRGGHLPSRSAQLQSRRRAQWAG